MPHRQFHRRFHGVGDIIEAELILQIQRHRLFIGRVHRRAAAAAHARGLSRPLIAGKRGFIDGCKAELAAREKIKRRRGIFRARRVRQCQADGDTHIRRAQLREHRAVDKLDQAVHHRLPVDNSCNLLKRQIVQPHCLDHFQALVHERGAVDGDLRAHCPVRMFQGLCFGHSS